jgi:hypothetical protein
MPNTGTRGDPRFATSASRLRRLIVPRKILRYDTRPNRKNDRSHFSWRILSAASLRTADRESACSDPRQIPVIVELNATGRVLRSVCRFLLGPVGFDSLSYEFCQFHGEFESSDYWRLRDLVRSDRPRAWAHLTRQNSRASLPRLVSLNRGKRSRLMLWLERSGMPLSLLAFVQYRFVTGTRHRT